MSLTYRKERIIFSNKYISCSIYYMNPGGIEFPHYHDGIEIEYVIRGNCKTHKQGKLYFRPKGQIHEGLNDTKEELVFLNITIPAETDENTHFLN